jgi:hypothetical protein
MLDYGFKLKTKGQAIQVCGGFMVRSSMYSSTKPCTVILCDVLETKALGAPKRHPQSNGAPSRFRV